MARSVGVFPGIPSLSPAEVVCFLHVWQGSIHFPWIRHWPTSRWFGVDWFDMFDVNDSGCCYKLVSRYFVVNKGDNGNFGKSLLKGSPNTAVNSNNYYSTHIWTIAICTICVLYCAWVWALFFVVVVAVFCSWVNPRGIVEDHQEKHVRTGEVDHGSKFSTFFQYLEVQVMCNKVS